MEVLPKPFPCKIAIVGEAPGAKEAETGMPFQGPSGHLLNQVLAENGIRRGDCFITNVFSTRPPDNKVEHFFTTKKNGVPGLPPLRAGKYLAPHYSHNLVRLAESLAVARPHLILALGATAAWALTGQGKITKTRGFVSQGFGPFAQYKVLPTVHPAFVLRDWAMFPILLADLIKAKGEAEFPEVRRVPREIWIRPTLEDIEQFAQLFLRPAPRIAFDIETKAQNITCISFADHMHRALVIPFFDEERPDGNYWPDQPSELRAWQYVEEFLSLAAEKVGQNGLYDMQYLWKTAGIPVRNYSHDTMLLHHSIQPELPKSLSFLGSIYTNETAWKMLREEYGKDEGGEEEDK